MGDEEEEDDLGYTGISCLLLVLGGAVLVGYMFVRELTFYTGQLPGACLEGRLQDQALRHARFAVDDSERNSDNNNEAHLQCKFPVNVYRCPEDQAGPCLQAVDTNPAALRLMPQRTRAEKEILTCNVGAFTFGLGKDDCSDKKWDCATGPCTGYEKAQRICASKLRKSWYACYFELGDPDAGVRREAVGFPVGWLLAAIAAMIFTLACTAYVANCLHKQGESITSGIAKASAGICCMSLLLVIISIIVNAVGCGGANAKGSVSVSLANLTVVDGSSQVVPEEEPVETTPVWVIVLIVLCSILCPMLCVASLICGLQGGSSTRGVHSDSSDDEGELLSEDSE